MQMLPGIYIRLKLNTFNHTCNLLGTNLHKISLPTSSLESSIQRSVASKPFSHRNLIIIGKNTATADIHLFIQLNQ